MTTTPTASPELLDLDKLEALARAATPGRWMRLWDERTVYDRMEDGCRGNAIVRGDLGYSSQDANNLDFIAAANPAAVLALIALARRAKPEGEAPQAVDTPESMAQSNARFAIDGAIQYGRENRNEPPSTEHWLYEYWNIGRQLAQFGATGWDNVTPAPAATFSPLCGAQHAESGKEAYQVFSHDSGEWYGVDEAQYDRAHYSCRRVLAAQQAAAQGTVTDYGTSVPGTPEAPKQPAHGHRDDYYLLANGRRLGLEPISRVRNMPNWVLAMELFATGSSSAHQICRDAGIDPDSTTIQRATAPKGGVA